MRGNRNERGVKYNENKIPFLRSFRSCQVNKTRAGVIHGSACLQSLMPRLYIKPLWISTQKHAFRWISLPVAV